MNFFVNSIIVSLQVPPVKGGGERRGARRRSLQISTGTPHRTPVTHTVA